MSYRYDQDALPEEDADENFVLRHWRGHLSLPVSWFLVGGLLSTVLVWILLAGVLAVESGSTSLRVIAAAWIAFFGIFLVLRIWGTVGIWRSAGLHVARGGQPFWAGAARVLLGLGVLGSVGQAASYARQVWEYGQLAAGRDPLGDPALLQLDDRGQEISIRGMLTEGTAKRFEQLAQQAPNLTTISLDSNGGRIFEAQHLAEYVRDHHLSTSVETNCESACTLILLAGETRYADSNAKIGFHQPDFPGFTAEQRQAAIEANSQDYIAAGMDPKFVERAMQTPPEQMWFPTHEELVEANVINGDAIVVGVNPSEDGLGQDLAAAAGEVNSKVPVKLDQITTLVGAQAEKHSLMFKYELSVAVDAARAKVELKQHIHRQLCADEDSKALIARGANYVFRYSQPKGNSFEFSVTACS